MKDTTSTNIDTEATSIPQAAASNQQLQDALRAILIANNIKEGTAKARTMEFGFLHGVRAADPRQWKNAFVTICMLTSRSILTVTGK